MAETIWWKEPPKDWDIPNARVAWAMPTYGPLYPQVYKNHLAVAAYASRFLKMTGIGDVPFIGSTDRMYLHTACNTTVKSFLESDCTHIFWTESDMLLPYYTIPALLQHDKDICSGVYFLRNGGGQPCLYLRGDVSLYSGVHAAVPVSLFPEDSLFKVHCPGMGCVLMKREVFEKISPPWFDLKEGWLNDDADRKIFGYGQDIFFYSNVAKAGFDVWVDSSIHCGQIMDHTISINDYRNRIAEPDFKVTGAIIGDIEEKGSVNDATVPDDNANVDIDSTAVSADKVNQGAIDA